MSVIATHDFGKAPEDGADHFVLCLNLRAGGTCKLMAVEKSDKGFDHVNLAEIPSKTWKRVSKLATRELASSLEDKGGKKKTASAFKEGDNRLPPILGRELTVLLWGLAEDLPEEHTIQILQGWRELAREERWWFYAKAREKRQIRGLGWRRAIFYALSGEAEKVETTTLRKKKSPSSDPGKAKAKKVSVEKEQTLFDLGV